MLLQFATAVLCFTPEMITITAATARATYVATAFSVMYHLNVVVFSCEASAVLLVLCGRDHTLRPASAACTYPEHSEEPNGLHQNSYEADHAEQIRQPHRARRSTDDCCQLVRWASSCANSPAGAAKQSTPVAMATACLSACARG